MPSANKSLQSRIPSIDRLLRLPELEALSNSHGQQIVTETARECLAGLRKAISTSSPDVDIPMDDAVLSARIAAGVAGKLEPSLRRVHNLTGTVLHTNLGRAALPDEAMDAVRAVATGASNLEYDIGKAGGWIASALSGEGLVLKFRGNGRILVQSHDRDRLGRALGPLLPPRKG